MSSLDKLVTAVVSKSGSNMIAKFSYVDSKGVTKESSYTCPENGYEYEYLYEPDTNQEYEYFYESVRETPHLVMTDKVKFYATTGKYNKDKTAVINTNKYTNSFAQYTVDSNNYVKNYGSTLFDTTSKTANEVTFESYANLERTKNNPYYTYFPQIKMTQTTEDNKPCYIFTDKDGKECGKVIYIDRKDFNGTCVFKSYSYDIITAFQSLEIIGACGTVDHRYRVKIAKNTSFDKTLMKGLMALMEGAIDNS